VFDGIGEVAILMMITTAPGYISTDPINQGSVSLYIEQTLPIRDVSSARAALSKLRGEIMEEPEKRI
jgi:hypothetical protein